MKAYYLKVSVNDFTLKLPELLIICSQCEIVCFIKTLISFCYIFQFLNDSPSFQCYYSFFNKATITRIIFIDIKSIWSGFKGITIAYRMTINEMNVS